MGDNTRDLKRRIRSVGNIQQITKAMEAVAAVKLRRAQGKVIKARPYVKKLQELLNRLTAVATDTEHPLMKVPESGTAACVLITSDRGLCGGYNAHVIRHTVPFLDSTEKVVLVPVGRRGRDYFRIRGWDFEKTFLNIGEDPSPLQAREIAQYLMDSYQNGIFNEVHLVYTKFVTVMQQRPMTVKLLPLDKEAFTDSDLPPIDYIYEPSAAEVLTKLLPKYVETLIFQALLEAKASEQGARMIAMGNATKNADEMIESLNLSFNRARQAGITKELAEIVGGADALRK